jgi:hypothetical protein
MIYCGSKVFVDIECLLKAGSCIGGLSLLQLEFPLQIVKVLLSCSLKGDALIQYENGLRELLYFRKGAGVFQVDSAARDTLDCLFVVMRRLLELV